MNKTSAVDTSIQAVSPELISATSSANAGTAENADAASTPTMTRNGKRLISSMIVSPQSAGDFSTGSGASADAPVTAEIPCTTTAQQRACHEWGMFFGARPALAGPGFAQTSGSACRTCRRLR
jgi:hypothetical protein